jgi:uncharacterized RDD family membrane protein YckC
MPPAISPAVRAEELDKLSREIITPEGVPIRFNLAPVGERITALLIDLLILIGVLIGMGVLLMLVSGGRPSWLTAALVIFSFFVQNMYFAFFEVRWQGSTPGKRRAGIRVIDARGGQLEISAVLARNLVRELELWMPLRLLLAGNTVWPEAPGWANAIAILWTFVFVLLPLFNKDKLRVGDLIGGTRVVMQPKPVLLPDLVNEAVVSQQRAARPSHAFTETQLGVYGVYELQVLEEVLRKDPSTNGYEESLRAVADKIRLKIEYRGVLLSDYQFLRDYYVALRAHLEQKMLFGKKRRDKFTK